jgi:hypothetical protein
VDCYSRYNLPDLRKLKLLLLARRGEEMPPQLTHDIAARTLLTALAWVSFAIIGAASIVMVLLIVEGVV